MKKKRDIILDFTSLLDVIMIILFFFILFGKIETDGLKADLMKERNEIESQRAEEEEQLALKNAELEEKNEKLEEMLADAAEKEKKAQELLNEANDAEKRSGDNVSAISEFSQNRNIKISLNMDSDGENWSLNIVREDVVETIAKTDVTSLINDIKTIFEKNGYSVDDTILLELFYDATQSGTTAAYGVITKVLEGVKKTYTHCFFSETDKSML